jgi:hypothetical protein
MRDPLLICFIDDYKIPVHTNTTTLIVDVKALNKAGYTIYDWAEKFGNPCNSNGELVYMVGGLGVRSDFYMGIENKGLISISLKEGSDYVFVDNPRKFETEQHRPYRPKEYLKEVENIPWLDGEINECGRAKVWKVKDDAD